MQTAAYLQAYLVELGLFLQGSKGAHKKAQHHSQSTDGNLEDVEARLALPIFTACPLSHLWLNLIFLTAGTKVQRSMC
jgi:hypothetical protein